MSDKHIIKVRMLGACVIITVPAAIREITGIEDGDYVFVQAEGKRGFTVTRGAIPAKKKPAAKKAAKPAPKKIVKKATPKKVVKAEPKKVAPKPAPKKVLAAPPVKKKIVASKPPAPTTNAVPLMPTPADPTITLPESY